MTPAHFGVVWFAETLKLLSRTSARLGFAVLLVLAALPPVLAFALKLVLGWAGGPDSAVNGVAVAEYFALPAPEAVGWALYLRNYFVAKAFVILLGTQILAAEYQANTLREDLLRPVPRWALLTAKWLALCTWAAATALFSWALATLLGLVFFGGAGDWRDPALGFFASILSDAGFAAIVLFIAVLTRSVPFTIVGVFLFAILDYTSDWALWIVDNAGSMLPIEYGRRASEVAEALYPWMPFSAFGVWRGYAPNVDWSWQGFASLGILTALAMGGALLAFRRIDVP